MILDATQSELLQRCDGCEEERVLKLADLILGLDHPQGGQGLDPNIVRLPPCPCGSVEFLNRTWDRYPVPTDEAGNALPLHAAAQAALDHRRRVNAVGDRLRELGRISPGNAKRVLAESVRPPDLGTLAETFDQPSAGMSPAVNAAKEKTQ